MICHNYRNRKYKHLIVPVGDGIGLEKFPSFSGILMRNGAIGLQGDSGTREWEGGLFSSINDWNIILMAVLGNLKTHLK